MLYFHCRVIFSTWYRVFSKANAFLLSILMEMKNPSTLAITTSSSLMIDPTLQRVGNIGIGNTIIPFRNIVSHALSDRHNFLL